MYFLRRAELRCAQTGLVQQSVQIVASHDLTLVVARSNRGRWASRNLDLYERAWRLLNCRQHQIPSNFDARPIGGTQNNNRDLPNRKVLLIPQVLISRDQHLETSALSG